MKRELERPTRGATTTQPLDYMDALAYLGQLKGQDELFFALMLFTGRRFSDVARMTWEDVEGDAIYLKEQKTGKRARVVINDKLRVILDKTPPEERKGFLLHPKKRPYKPLSINGANHRFRQISAELGIEAEKISTHALRKTFARALYDRYGIDVVAQILNHDSQRTTRRYLGLTEELIEDAYRSL